jgi:hypothetical protein
MAAPSPLDRRQLIMSQDGLAPVTRASWHAGLLVSRPRR